MNYFTKKIIEKIKANGYAQNVVISDMRFPHEYYYIKTKLTDYEIKSVRIQRNIHNVIDDYSEKALDNFHFDMIIHNDDSLLNQLFNLEPSVIRA